MCSATRCAICSIRACVEDDDRAYAGAPRRAEETSMTQQTVARIARAAAAALALASGTCAFAQAQAAAKAEKPQYGGALRVGLVYYTVSPLSFDAADWPWKHNQDTGLAYEQLFAADLAKAKRNGGKYPFISDAYLPSDGLRGELAEKWQLLQNPWRLEVQLRKGVMFPAKPGGMPVRDHVAVDVVYCFDCM